MVAQGEEHGVPTVDLTVPQGLISKLSVPATYLLPLTNVVTSNSSNMQWGFVLLHMYYLKKRISAGRVEGYWCSGRSLVQWKVTGAVEGHQCSGRSPMQWKVTGAVEGHCAWSLNS